jgi:predicted TIM-barrel fold metal-dependent hydrolase
VESYGIVDCDFHPTVVDIPGVMKRYLTSAQCDRLRWLGVANDSGLIRGYRGSFRPVGRAHHFVDDPHPEYRVGDQPAAADPDFIRQTYLDPENVAAAVLISLDAAMVDTWSYAEEAAWYVSALNNYLLDEWVAKEPRFSLDMVVSPLAIDLAVEEIHRIGANPGVSAIYLPMLDTLFGDRKFYPIWEAALEHSLPVMVHPMSADDTIGSARRAGGLPNSWAERYITLGQFGQSHLASMIFEGVFERYPDLRIIFVEFGWPWLPSFLDRMDVTWKAARRYHPYMTMSPTDYVKRNVRFTTEPTLEVPNNKIDTLLDWCHASEVLLYSSDYPHWDSETPGVIFHGIEDSLRRRIFRENAVEFFGRRLRLVEPSLTA